MWSTASGAGGRVDQGSPRFSLIRPARQLVQAAWPDSRLQSSSSSATSALVMRSMVTARARATNRTCGRFYLPVGSASPRSSTVSTSAMAAQSRPPPPTRGERSGPHAGRYRRSAADHVEMAAFDEHRRRQVSGRHGGHDRLLAPRSQERGDRAGGRSAGRRAGSRPPRRRSRSASKPSPQGSGSCRAPGAGCAPSAGGRRPSPPGASARRARRHDRRQAGLHRPAPGRAPAASCRPAQRAAWRCRSGRLPRRQDHRRDRLLPLHRSIYCLHP